MRYPPSSSAILTLATIALLAISVVQTSILLALLFNDSPRTSLFSGLASDSAETPFRPINLVIPFTVHDAEAVLANLNEIWPRFPPCSGRDARHLRTHLILYFDMRLVEVDRGALAKRLLAAARRWQKIPSSGNGRRARGELPHGACFDSVRLVDARLSKQESSYPLGPSLMFFRLVEHLAHASSSATVGSGVPTLYYMEPDNRPCRESWLPRLHREASVHAPFWIRGSAPRFPGTPATFFDHVNGNALYNLDDVKFLEFLGRVERQFLEAPDEFIWSYDVAMEVVRRREGKEGGGNGASLHLWQYTPFVQNWYRTNVNITELCSADKETYLVHGRSAAY
ncbi:hypothetical protein DFJ73DRAFT_762791 [Zopfochytrium polystomum]|nr:hypothetical protein DFJ73DRAFT_762791 [Zopfochytrium polystomum]